MSAPEAPRRQLPDKPSIEFIRKEAKRLGKAEGLKLADAQRSLARAYGHRSWAALVRAVDEAGASPLSRAAARGDVEQVRALLAAGAPVDGDPGELNTPLFRACASDASAERRLAVAQLLIEAGAFTRRGCANGATPLHAAARRGPASLVRLLLRSGALFWQGDGKGVRAHDYAKRGRPVDRDEILYLLADGPRIEDQDFRDAVAAIQAGDIPALGRVLDKRPSLLRERAIEPEIGPRGYFTDPKLFWFIANNPTLAPQSPDNIVAVAEHLLARGVEREDLDYALALAMTNALMPEGQQIALVRTLVKAGARVSDADMLSSLGHRQRAPAAWLVDNGVVALDAPIAAALGRIEALPALLANASRDEAGDALAMAVINREREAARLCLQAGADPNRFMPCHAHATAMHQAALDGDVEMLELLVAHGGRTDVQDTLWRGTPLGWALHGDRREAAAYLRGLGLDHDP